MTTKQKFEQLEKRLDAILKHMAEMEEHKDFEKKLRNKAKSGRNIPTKAEIHKRIDRRFKTKLV